MASNYDIKYSDMLLGSIFFCESLGTEFKKFVLSNKIAFTENNKREINDLFRSGLITEQIDIIITSIIKKYIEEYVPKYTTCFLNSDNFLNHSESFLFIGIDDDGTISGIPFNFKINSANMLCEYIGAHIKRSIYESIANNLLSHEEIANCVDFSLIIFEKKTKSFLEKKSLKKQLEMEKLAKEIVLLEKEKETLEQPKMEINFLLDSITIESYKQNSSVNKKILDYIIKSKHFPIKYDNENKAHVEFLFNSMTKFNPKKYNRQYMDVISKYYNIEHYIEFPQDEIALGTFLHEEIKKITERLKKKANEFFSEVKAKIVHSQRVYKIKMATYDIMYYDMDNYFSIINKHSDNSYFMIRIRFDIKKYKEKLRSHPKYISNDKHYLGYLDDSRKVIISQRGLKLKDNKIDPECYKL